MKYLILLVMITLVSCAKSKQYVIDSRNNIESDSSTITVIRDDIHQGRGATYSIFEDSILIGDVSNEDSITWVTTAKPHSIHWETWHSSQEFPLMLTTEKNTKYRLHISSDPSNDQGIGFTNLGTKSYAEKIKQIRADELNLASVADEEIRKNEACSMWVYNFTNINPKTEITKKISDCIFLIQSDTIVIKVDENINVDTSSLQETYYVSVDVSDNLPDVYNLPNPSWSYTRHLDHPIEMSKSSDHMICGYYGFVLGFAIGATISSTILNDINESDQEYNGYKSYSGAEIAGAGVAFGSILGLTTGLATFGYCNLTVKN